jgi:ubiquinone/menaquinone biosynthesis C-methylase UbiE
MQNKPAVDRSLHVPESSFGIWFLGTGIWDTRVLEIAINDLKRLITNDKKSWPVIVDVGCGLGGSFKRLHDLFAPDLLIGVDIDAAMLHRAALKTTDLDCQVSLIHGTSSSLALADQSADMLFCHQTFHHLVDQDGAIREFYRVLRPGGLLLFAESTKAYIHSWIIRLLFRHPMDVQKTAPEYVRFIENAGFEIAPDSISYPYLWWSRADLGIRENWFGIAPPSDREETLINLVAVKGPRPDDQARIPR